MIEAYVKALRNWNNFDGRSSVKDYWLAFATNFVIAIVMGVITFILTFIGALISEGLGNVIGVLCNIVSIGYSLIILVPFIALAVRRMHDQGKPGWIVGACYAGSLCCGIGSIILIVFMCLPGVVGPNEYGPDPSGNDFNNFNGGGYGNNQFNNPQYGNQNQQFNNAQYGNQQFNNAQYGQNQQYDGNQINLNK